MSTDEHHLNLLSLFHFIAAGITAAFACFPLVYVVSGIVMMLGPFNNGETTLNVLGMIILAIGIVAVSTGWTLAAAMIVVGRKLRARRSHTFCLVVSVIECLLVPFGTVLGVFTVLVLVRPSVAQLFASRAG